jgi:CPA2 family monovalent cation:H+ antiporter-2
MGCIHCPLSQRANERSNSRCLLYLVAAVLGVVACRRLKLPPMLGYLAVGVLIGPNALALAKTRAHRHLAEFGVVFLMFVIGLEFNLPKLRAMRSRCSAWGCRRWC